MFQKILFCPQGGTLSVTIFILCEQCLAKALVLGERFTGVIIAHNALKVSMLADDTLLFLTVFTTNLKGCLQYYTNFPSFQADGLIYLNHKPFLLVVNDKKLFYRVGLTCRTRCLKYLGIWILVKDQTGNETYLL